MGVLLMLTLNAFSCVGQPSPKTEWQRSDLVFIGEVHAVDGHQVSVDVLEPFKPAEPGAPVTFTDIPNFQRVPSSQGSATFSI